MVLINFYVDKLLFFWRKRKVAKENIAAFVRLALNFSVIQHFTAFIRAFHQTFHQALGNAAGFHYFSA